MHTNTNKTFNLLDSFFYLPGNQKTDNSNLLHISYVLNTVIVL